MIVGRNKKTGQIVPRIDAVPDWRDRPENGWRPARYRREDWLDRLAKECELDGGGEDRDQVFRALYWTQYESLTGEGMDYRAAHRVARRTTAQLLLRYAWRVKQTDVTETLAISKSTATGDIARAARLLAEGHVAAARSRPLPPIPAAVGPTGQSGA